MPESEAVQIIRDAARRASDIAKAKARANAPLSGTFKSLQERVAERIRAAKAAEEAGTIEPIREWEPPVYKPTKIQLLNACRVPGKYRAVDLSDLRGLPSDCAADFADRVAKLRSLIQKRGIIVVLGVRGSGKTWMACGAVMEFCRAQRSALYAEAADVFNELRETFRGEGARHTQVEAEFVRPELLVLDEMQERGQTEFEDRVLTRLVNKRYNAERATVLVTNQTKEECAARVGESIADRIRECGGAIVCGWPSLRGRLVAR